MSEDLIAIHQHTPVNNEILNGVSFLVYIVLNIERLKFIKQAHHPTLSFVETLDDRDVLSLRFDCLVKLLVLESFWRVNAFLNIFGLGINLFFECCRVVCLVQIESEMRSYLGGFIYFNYALSLL